MSIAELDHLLDEPPPTVPQHRSARPTDSFASRARWAAPWLAMLVIAGALAPFRDRWVVQVVLLGWLSFAPGRLLLTALRLRPIQVRRFPVYTVAMSLLLIMVEALAVDGIGIALADEHPLRSGPLWTGTVIGYLLLVALAAAAPAHIRPRLSRPPSPWAYWILALPLLAAAGAYRLNSGHGSTVALVAMIALVAVWLVRPFLPGFTWRTASITVYAVSLAGCWSFSLRGDSVYGYDIITEYFIGRTTAANGIWHLSHHNDAYGALLSVTILPVSLHSVAGIALLAVFKAVFPALFAFVPVGVLRIAGRLLSVRWAYVAVGIVIGQSFFFDSMPAVARQEIAFLFFVVVIAALLESRNRAAIPLIVLGGVGMVFSHYSSTYMTAALAGAAALFALIGRVLRRKPPLLRAAFAFAVTLGGALLWYRLLTDSASNTTNVADSLKTHGFSLLPNRGSNIISTIISGNVSKALTPQQYATEVAREYAKNFPYVQPFGQAVGYRLVNPPTEAGGGAVAGAGGVVVSVIGQLVNVLAVVGGVVLTFGRRRGAVARAVGLLSLGVLGFLAAIRLSGTVAAAYNQERAQIQAFMLLGPTAVWTLLWLARSAHGRLSLGTKFQRVRRTPSTVVGLAVLASTVLVLNASGLMSSSPTDDGNANLSSGGEDVARFVQTNLDLTGARWLEESRARSQLVYADAYGQLRLLAQTGSLDGIAANVTPRTLGRGAWIYAYSANTRADTARASVNGGAVRYRYPAAYVDRYFDRVYANGTSEVFH